MYKIIITMFISLFLFMGCYTNSNAGNHYVTAGGHYFAYTESSLDQVLYLQKRGDIRSLWFLVDMGFVKVFPAEIPIGIVACNIRGKMIIVVPEGSENEFWIIKKAIKHRGY